MDTPDLNAGLNAVQAQKANTQGFLSGQNALTGDFLQRYTGAINAQEGAGAMATRLGSELGLPQLQKNAFSLQQSLYDMPGLQTDAARGTDTNANQLGRLIAQKQSEIAPSAQRAQENANFAQASVDKQVGYGQQDQARALLPFQTEQSLLSDRLARETTLYSQDNENELNAILQKMQAGITLSEGEKNRAQALAISEKQYNLEKDKISASQNQNQKDYTTVSAGQTIVDPATGRVVYSAPYKPTTSGGGSNVGSYLNTAPTYFTPNK